MHLHKVIKTDIGPIHLVSDGKDLVGLCFEENWNEEKGQFGDLQNKDCSLFKEVEIQLSEYLKGARKKFDIPIRIKGTDFQKKAWQVLQTIPYGKTISYSDQAKKIGKEKAVRAVGSANKRNPIAIIIPCHRVISKSGKLSGFNGGIDVKKMLLETENRKLSS